MLALIKKDKLNKNFNKQNQKKNFFSQSSNSTEKINTIEKNFHPSDGNWSQGSKYFAQNNKTGLSVTKTTNLLIITKLKTKKMMILARHQANMINIYEYCKIKFSTTKKRT